MGYIDTFFAGSLRVILLYLIYSLDITKVKGVVVKKSDFMQTRLGYGPLITGCGGEPWPIKKIGEGGDEGA